MKLYLVQHGDAVDKKIDPARPLSDLGRSDVTGIADLLKARDVVVKHIFHSGKERAMQTAKILADRLSYEEKAEKTDGLAPLDPTRPWVQKAGNLEEDTMIVGHMPFMGKLAAHLVTGDADRTIVAFQPGSVLCLEQIDDSGSWAVAGMVRP